MSDYTAMREAGEQLLEGKRQEHDAAMAEAEAALLEGKRQADLGEQLATEIEAIEKFIDHARELEQDFGDGPSQPKPKAAPPRRAAPAPSSPPPAGGGGRAAPRPRVSRGAFREQARDKIVEALREIGEWTKSTAIMEKTGLTKQTFLRAVRELVEAGKVEKTGATVTLRYRLAETKTPATSGPPPGRQQPADPPPPKRPAAKTPAATEPPVGGLRGRVLDYVDRHKHSTDKEVAQGLGRGTKPGQVEVTRILENLQDEGRLGYDVDGVDRRWRLPKVEPLRVGAAVQTSPDHGGSHQLHTDLEREIVRAVADKALSIEEIAAVLEKEKQSVWKVVNALVGRGILRRGTKGTTPVFGKAQQ